MGANGKRNVLHSQVPRIQREPKVAITYNLRLKMKLYHDKKFANAKSTFNKINNKSNEGKTPYKNSKTAKTSQSNKKPDQ